MFTDKYFLVKLLYRLLEKPSKVKNPENSLSSFAFYGATYGNLQCDNEDNNDFSEQVIQKTYFLRV